MNRLIALSLAAILLFANSSFAQDSTGKRNHVRNILWGTPVIKSTTINGLAVGFWETAPWKGAQSLTINGVNLDVDFVSSIYIMYALGSAIVAPFNQHADTADVNASAMRDGNIYPDSNEPVSTKIRGISVSAGGLGTDIKMSGISINGGVSGVHAMHGIEFSSILNLHYDFRGIMVTVLRNKTTTGKGLQIGLSNNCKKGQVVQIGLINRIGKRVTPIINFRFKKDRKLAKAAEPVTTAAS